MELAQQPKQYKRTAHCVHSCQYHVVFCPKYRRPVLTEQIGNRLKEIIGDLESKFDFQCIESSIMLDHVHLLIQANPDIGIKKIVSEIKGVSSNLLRSEFPELKSRLPTLWTRSKFISTCGTVSLEVVQKYIENQKGI